MNNGNDINSELLRLKSASESITKQTLNRILSICDTLIDDELPAYVKERLADIDAGCCKLLRDRALLNRLADYLSKKATDEKCCSLSDVYANCCRTIDAICGFAGKAFSFSEFIPEYKLNVSAEECCLLLLLPVALAFECDNDNDVRLIASRKGDKLELEYTFKGKVPPVEKLAAECGKTDSSSGLYFTDSLLALALKETVADCGASLSVNNNKLTVQLTAADKNAIVNSAAESYIDNRFSLPYIMLAGIVRREI